MHETIKTSGTARLVVCLILGLIYHHLDHYRLLGMKFNLLTCLLIAYLFITRK